MRDIKFRAWDKKLDIMWEPISLSTLLNYLVFQDCPNADAYEALKDHFKDFKWLEFTGLKDKNGKEIYEGDIIKIDSLACDDYNGITTTVVWKGAGFVGLSPEINISSWHDGVRVIGNIYENPKGLNAKDIIEKEDLEIPIEWETIHLGNKLEKWPKK